VSGVAQCVVHDCSRAPVTGGRCAEHARQRDNKRCGWGGGPNDPAPCNELVPPHRFGLCDRHAAVVGTLRAPSRTIVRPAAPVTVRRVAPTRPKICTREGCDTPIRKAGETLCHLHREPLASPAPSPQPRVCIEPGCGADLSRCGNRMVRCPEHQRAYERERRRERERQHHPCAHYGCGAAVTRKATYCRRHGLEHRKPRAGAS
jgi:hypothetical protein